MSDYINAIDTATEFGITKTSLYKIINHPDLEKRLEPVNRSTYKGDGGYMFKREDVARMKLAYKREDLTSSEAAKRIGRSTTYIHKLFREGLLPFYEGELRGKKTYFCKEADLEQFKLNHPDSGKYDIVYEKKSGVFLFQPYHKEGRNARVVKMKRVNRTKLEIDIQTDTNEFIRYEHAYEDGWRPSLSITNKKAITSYGYAKFEFPIPTTLDSMIYRIIEELFQQVGPANMRITFGEKLIVESKKSVLHGVLPTTHPDMIDKLKLFIKSGEITHKYDGTLIDTGLSPITVYLPESHKLELISRAAEEKKSLQDWIESRLALIEVSTDTQ